MQGIARATFSPAFLIYVAREGRFGRYAGKPGNALNRCLIVQNKYFAVVINVTFWTQRHAFLASNGKAVMPQAQFLPDWLHILLRSFFPAW
ncbi:hypothetical protein D3C75_1236380 [compost metagenome]